MRIAYTLDYLTLYLRDLIEQLFRQCIEDVILYLQIVTNQTQAFRVISNATVFRLE